ncbi:hypothetical protein, partial [Streptomyces clavuligerus]
CRQRDGGPRGGRGRAAVRAAAGGALAVALAASLLLAPGAAPATAGTPVKPVKPVAPVLPVAPVARAGSAVLPTGDRVEPAAAPGAAAPAVRLVPLAGQEQPGRYAYTQRGGELTLRPAGLPRALPATTVNTTTGSTTTGGTPTGNAAGRGARGGPFKVGVVLTGATANGPVVQVWNRTTWAYHEVTVGTRGADGTVWLPPGDYLAVGMYGGPAADHLLARAFTVRDRALTVAMDARAARETAVTTDDSTARRAGAAVSLRLPNGEVVGFMGGRGQRVLVTPFTLKGISLRVHEVQVKKGTTANVPSPYRYELVKEFRDTVPATPRATVRTAGLARTVLTLRSPGLDTIGWLSSSRDLRGNTSSTVATPVRLPARVTEYATPGIAVRHTLDSPDGPALTTGRRLPAAGGSTGHVLGAAPFGAGACALPQSEPSELRGTRLTFAEPCAYGDGYGHQGLDRDATEDLELTSRGALVARERGRALGAPWSVTLKETGVPHTLYQTVRHTDSPRRYTRTQHSVWTFVPGGPGARPGELPLSDVRMRVSGLSDRNTAGSAPVTVHLTASSRTGRVTATPTSLEYSTDDGGTWHPLRLSGTADLTPGSGGDRRSARFTVPSGARYVSLRARAAAADGTTLTRTLLRAFGGPAPLADEQAGGIKVSHVTVNGSRTVVPAVGEGFGDADRVYDVTYTVTHPTGVAGSGVRLYRGAFDRPDAVLPTSTPHCARKSADTSVCTAYFSLDARTELGRNAFAGEWRAAAYARSAGGTSLTSRSRAGTVQILRATKLTSDGPDGKVSAGRSFTLTGTARAADWATGLPVALPGRSARLEFRARGEREYLTVGRVTTDSRGGLRISQRATRDGYWRWVLPVASGTAARTSPRVFVDVR